MIRVRKLGPGYIGPLRSLGLGIGMVLEISLVDVRRQAYHNWWLSWLAPVLYFEGSSWSTLWMLLRSSNPEQSSPRQHPPAVNPAHQLLDTLDVFDYIISLRLPRNKTAYAAIIALNLALLTIIFLLLFLHTSATSDPICSPSRSQSVQIMTISARRASFWRFLSIGFRLYQSALSSYLKRVTYRSDKGEDISVE